jgi:acyl-CoA thioester hydrolase
MRSDASRTSNRFKLFEKSSMRSVADPPAIEILATRMAEQKTITQQTIDIRVRYPEADPMGYVHHSVYLQYFEMGRIELLRHIGQSYADLEKQGVLFVVTKMEIRYRAPARFDDLLQITTRLVRQGPVRLDHAYEVRRGEVLVCEGNSTIACVGPDGVPRAIPDAVLVAES